MNQLDMDNKNPEEKESRRRMAAEARKANKPLMEKRRRERINTCLDQLKDILMDATKKESSYYSKLEKADILEMTVKYLKNLKRQQMSATGAVPSSTVADSTSTMNKYIAGFNECSQEVTRYLNSMHGINDDIRSQMLGHLADSLHQSSNTANHTSSTTSAPSIAPMTSVLPLVTQAAANQKSSTGQPFQVHTHSQPHSIARNPEGSSQGNPHGNPQGSSLCVISPAGPSQQQTTFQSSPMQLVPAKLPTGETVFVLASAGSYIAGNLNIAAPVLPAQQPQNVISLVNSSMDKVNGNQNSKKWTSPAQEPTIISPLNTGSYGLCKPCTISKSPSSDDESVFDTSRSRIKTSSPVLSDHNANISDSRNPFMIPSYTPILSKPSNNLCSQVATPSQATNSFSFTGGCQFRTPRSSLDDSRNESVSSTSDSSISSPIQKDNDRLQRHSSSSSSYSSTQQNPQLDHSASLLDPMWRPW